MGASLLARAKSMQGFVDKTLRLVRISLLFRDARAVQMLLIALRQIMPVLPFSEITFSINYDNMEWYS